MFGERRGEAGAGGPGLWLPFMVVAVGVPWSCSWSKRECGHAGWTEGCARVHSPPAYPQGVSRVSHEGDPTRVCTPGHQEAVVGRTLAGGVQSRTAGVSP